MAKRKAVNLHKEDGVELTTSNKNDKKGLSNQ